MAKLYYRYGAMNSGKTTAIIQCAYNYEERDQEIYLIKAKKDTKGEDKIVSRIGLERNVDFLIAENDSIIDKIENKLDKINAILVDEAQFLTEKQISELFYITKIYDLPVICYGLKTDFQTNSFPGSKRLYELADELDELSTICRCGKKARFNARKVNGAFVTEGNQVAIDGEEKVEYESMCGKCLIKRGLFNGISK